MNPMRVVELGVMSYGEALALQREVAQARIDGRLDDDVLLLLEHPPVITFGRSSHDENLLASGEELERRGVEVFEVERGGDVTLHAPGQLVGYPIFALGNGPHPRDLHRYLRQLEAALILALAEFGVVAGRNPGHTGVWVPGKGEGADGGGSGRSGALEPGSGPVEQDRPRGRKIASIGVHAKQWVTWHGFALNVTTDLALFDLLVPCGIEGVVMTSIAAETGVATPMADVAPVVAAAFGQTFGLEPVGADRVWLSALSPQSIGRTEPGTP